MSQAKQSREQHFNFRKDLNLQHPAGCVSISSYASAGFNKDEYQPGAKHDGNWRALSDNDSRMALVLSSSNAKDSTSITAIGQEAPEA